MKRIHYLLLALIMTIALTIASPKPGPIIVPFSSAVKFQTEDELIKPPELPIIFNADEAEQLLCAALNFPLPNWIVGPEDSVYISPDKEEITELLSFIYNRREGLYYTPQAFDCDDWATEAKYWATIWSLRHYGGIRAALIFGKAYVKIHGYYDALFPNAGGQYVEAYHVINFVVRADGKVFFFEPQTGILAPVEAFIYEDSLTVIRLEY